MNKLSKQILFGFLTWLIPFVFSFLIWPLHDSMLSLFKSIMIVFGAITGVIFIVVYFKKISSGYLRDGITIGFIWLAINIILDLIVLVGLFKTPTKDYFIDIGIRYLMIPIITVGFGYILEYKNRK